MIVQGFIKLNEINCETSDKLASFKSNSLTDQQVYYERCKTSHENSMHTISNTSKFINLELDVKVLIWVCFDCCCCCCYGLGSSVFSGCLLDFADA